MGKSSASRPYQDSRGSSASSPWATGWILTRRTRRGEASVLVDDDSHLGATALHLAQEVEGAGGLGNLVGRAQDVFEDDEAVLPGEGEDVARDDVADDVVEAAVVDRHAAVALLEDDALDLLGRGAAPQGDDTGARDHDLGDGDPAEAQGARGDPAGARIDRAGLGG